MERRKHRNERGVTTVEFAFLTPVLFLLFLCAVEVVIYLQSRTAAQYAAFVAARAYQVYGDRTLESIHYSHLRESPYTHASQTIAEAAAEKVIFESLVWEHDRIEGSESTHSNARFYKDGSDLSVDGSSRERSEGAVRLNLLTKQLTTQGAEVTYCMPIISLVDGFFHSSKSCRTSRGGRDYEGVGITYKATFGREPLEP